MFYQKKKKKKKVSRNFWPTLCKHFSTFSLNACMHIRLYSDNRNSNDRRFYFRRTFIDAKSTYAVAGVLSAVSSVDKCSANVVSDYNQPPLTDYQIGH